MSKNIFWQFLSNVSGLLLSVMQLALLARILDAADFGYIAIVLVIVNIFQAITDSGMSNYLIHKQQLNQRINSTIFWLTLSIGVSFSLVIFAVASSIAAWYGYPQLTFLIQLSSVLPIFIGLSSQLQARYLMAFKHVALANIDMVSKALGIGSSISLALIYQQAWVMIAGLILTNLCKTVLLWFFSQPTWRAGWQFSIKEAKLGLNYGMYQFGGQLLNQIRGNLDMILLGIYLPVAELGVYTLAKNLIIKPSQVILPVVYKIMLPQIAKIKHDLAALQLNTYISHLITCAALAIIYLNLGTLAEPFIRVFYGEGYQSMVELFLPLTLFWLLRCCGGALVGALSQARGETNREFYWNLFSFFINTAVTYFAVQHGTEYLVWALLFMQVLLSPLIYYSFFYKTIRFSAYRYFMPMLLLFGLSALFSWSSYWLALNVLNLKNDALTVISVSFTSLALFTATLILFFANNPVVIRIKSVLRKKND